MISNHDSITIKGIACAVPSSIELNSDISAYSKEELEKIISTTGIVSRRVAKKGVKQSHLAEKAIQKLLADNDLNAQEIDVVIVVTQSQDFTLPGNSFILQKSFGFKEECYFLDVNQGCAGYVYGIHLAMSLMGPMNARNAIVVVGDIITEYIDSSDSYLKALFSDCVSATLLQTTSTSNVSSFSFFQDGSSYDVIHANKRSDDNRLKMDGLKVFNFGLSKLVPSISDFIERQALSIDDFDFFVLHQANKLLLENIRKRLMIPEHKFVYSIGEFGNTSSASIPLSICHGITKTKLIGDKKFLICGFGVGLSWGIGSIYTHDLNISNLIEVE